MSSVIMKPLTLSRILPAVMILIVFQLSGCGKDYSYEGGPQVIIPPPPPPVIPPITKEQQMKGLLSESSFQLTAFYTEVPIDYNETDSEIKSETDLWDYVIGYLKDDIFSFSDNGADVKITQNALLMPGLPDPIVNRQYDVTTDDDGVHFTFLDYQYNPLTYNLHEVGEGYFILSVESAQGPRLFSRYELLP